MKFGMAGVVIKTEQDRVYWMSDWSRCDELVRRGYLRSVHHGPGTCGHMSYYLPTIYRRSMGLIATAGKEEPENA